MGLRVMDGLTMCLFEVVVARVADVEYVCDSERRDHLTIRGVLPFAQVDLPREHLVAELLGVLPTDMGKLSH